MFFFSGFYLCTLIECHIYKKKARVQYRKSFFQCEISDFRKQRIQDSNTTEKRSRNLNNNRIKNGVNINKISTKEEEKKKT